MPLPMESQADRLGRGDSYTLLALLLGVLFVLVIPPFWLKVPGLTLVCIGCIGFVKKSHWTHQWSRAKQLWTAMAAIIVVCLASIPQLVSQWKSEHPAQSPISSLTPAALPSSSPTHSSLMAPVKAMTKRTLPKRPIAPASIPLSLSADEVADKVVKRIADQRPVSTPAPIPTPKPLCRGDNLSICTDEDLLEWGKPLDKEISRYYGYYETERDKAQTLSGNNLLAAMEKAENTLADRFRDCCAEETEKYYREICVRVGGGHQKTDFFEWKQQLMNPVGSKEWKAARQHVIIEVPNIHYELEMRMLDLDLAIKLKNLRH